MSASVQIDGNLTADPELRFTENGIPVSTFNVAHTPRRLNRQTNEFEDAGETLFLRVNVWRAQAENIAASLHKGDAVQVIGRLVQRNWTDKDTGKNRSTIECEAEIVSADLRRQRIQSVQRIKSGPAPEPQADAWAATRADVKAASAA